MSTLEQEIIEKFRQLELDAKQRVQAMIDQEMASTFEQNQKSDFDYAAWFRDIEALREQIRKSHGGKLPPIDVVGMLRDLRDGEDE